MKTIKNAIVIVIFLSVGYGAHVVLNKPVVDESYDNMDQGPLAAPLVDVGSANQLRPAVSLGGQQTNFATGGRDESLPLGGGPAQGQLTSFPLPQAERTAAQPITSAQPVTVAEPSGSAGTVAHISATAQSVPEPAGTTSQTTPSQPTANTSIDSEKNDTAADSHTDVITEVEGRPSAAGDFEKDWQAAQMKLNQGQLADALFTLSMWYGDRGVSEYRKAELTPLLDQLAGTVIYSREHYLEPPYAVPESVTLEQIAEEFQVPAMLLARINGLVPPFRLAPGQQLKVVRGPFRAEISRTRGELTLFLGGYYAGRFIVNLGQAERLPQDTLEVTEKLPGRVYVDTNTQDEIPAGHPNNPYGRHWIGLRQLSGSAQTDLGIHGTGEGCGSQDPRACVRLSPVDAEDLYAILSVGSKVTVTD